MKKYRPDKPKMAARKLRAAKKILESQVVPKVPKVRRMSSKLKGRIIHDSL